MTERTIIELTTPTAFERWSLFAEQSLLPLALSPIVAFAVGTLMGLW